MTKRMLIDATHHEETRVVVMDGSRLTEFDYESQFRRQLKGNIFLAKVTRVEPSLQAAFVNFGGNRHGFLPFSEIHPDYYRIPVADREALLEEQRQMEEEAARREAEEDAEEEAREARRQGEPAAPDEDGFVQPAAELTGEETETDDNGPESQREQAHDAHELALEETGFVHEEIDLSPDSGDDEENEEEDEEESDEGSETDESGESDESAAGEETQNEAASSEEGEGTESGRGGYRRGNNRRGWRRGGHNGGRRHMGARRHRSSSDEMADEGPAGLHARFRRRYKIQEVIKRGQIMLIQVSKEERGNKGAAVTTYLSLPGRYCVLMPNSPRGGGVSRKIGNFSDRRRLKSMLKSLEIPSGMSVILRTAGVERTEAEIKRDYDYLLRLWDNIREMTLASNAPALIYEEGDLIKRSIRDIYSSDIGEILISGPDGYNEARQFMNVLMPGHEDDIKQYTDDKIPLFHRYQVESQITEIGEPVVQLRSGGYLVINQTEALVAVDVNSGRATKERHIEETALKTNLEAAEEIARQLRLRDLGGLVVIDFIDMEDRRNNARVERRLKDALAGDRARIQVSRISTFGLLELSRQRLNPSLTEAQFQKCPHCHGFGFIRSVDSAAILALRALEDEGVRARTRRVTLHVPNAIALYILNEKRDMLATIEKRYGFSVMIHVDESLAPSNYTVEAMKEAPADEGEDEGDEGEPRAPRKKPVAMEQALESLPETDETDEGDNDDTLLPAAETEGEDESEGENFNRPDVEPDGKGARGNNRGPRRGGRDRNDRGERGERGGRDRGGRGPRRDRNRDMNRDSNAEGAQGPAPEQQPGGEQGESDRNHNRPRRGKYGPRRDRGNRPPRENGSGSNESSRPERNDQGFASDRPAATAAPEESGSAKPARAEPTFFVSKRRKVETANNDAPATESAAPALPPADVGAPASDPSNPKKKGWWSKFS